METETLVTRERALALKKKYGRQASMPKEEDIEGWTMTQLEDYFKAQAYLNSMLMSSSEEEERGGEDDGAGGEDDGAGGEDDGAGGQGGSVQGGDGEATDISEVESSFTNISVTSGGGRSEPPQRMKVLVYGATGYSGELVANHAARAGFLLQVAGRSEEKLKRLASRLPGRVGYKSFDLDDARALDAAVGSVDAVVHCAGPFHNTYKPMLEACLRQSKHYVDLTGEIQVIEAISKYDGEAKEKGVMLLPAAGFDVVPSDTLAYLVSEKFKREFPAHFPSHLRVAFHFNTQGALISRGTAATMRRGKRGILLERENGEVVEKVAKPKPLRERQRCSFGLGKELTVKQANMADVSSAFYSTGIPNIICQMSDVASMSQLKHVLTPFSEGVSSRDKSGKVAKEQPIGPDASENEEGKCFLHATVSSSGASTRQVSGSLECPAPYKVTHMAILHILREVEKNNFRAGFCTPTTAYGSGFLEACGMKKTS